MSQTSGCRSAGTSGRRRVRGVRDGVAAGQVHDEVHRLGVVHQRDLVHRPSRPRRRPAATACPTRSAPAPPGRPRRPTCAGPTAGVGVVVAGRAEVPQLRRSQRRAGIAHRPRRRSRPSPSAGSIARYSTAVPGGQVRAASGRRTPCTPATCVGADRRPRAAGDPALERDHVRRPLRVGHRAHLDACRARRCPRPAPRWSATAAAPRPRAAAGSAGCARRCPARPRGTAPACPADTRATSWNTWYGALSSVPIERQRPSPTCASNVTS